MKNYPIGRLVIAEAQGAFPHPGAMTCPIRQASLCFKKTTQLGKDLVLEDATLEALDCGLNDEQAYDIALRMAEQFYNDTNCQN